MDTHLEVHSDTGHVLGAPSKELGRLPEVAGLDRCGHEVDASHAAGDGPGHDRVHPPGLLRAPDTVTELPGPGRLDGRVAAGATLAGVAIHTAGGSADVAPRAEDAGVEGAVPALAIQSLRPTLGASSQGSPI